MARGEPWISLLAGGPTSSCPGGLRTGADRLQTLNYLLTGVDDLQLINGRVLRREHWVTRYPSLNQRQNTFLDLLVRCQANDIVNAKTSIVACFGKDAVFCS